MMWIAKDTKGSPLLVLHSFYKERVSMALQRVQADSISRRAVTAREGSLSLGVLSRVFLGLEFYGVYLPFL
jgi:hypothetical protein